VAGGTGEPGVERYERSVERFRERDVRGVVCSQVFAQLPDASDERLMRMPPNEQHSKIVERFRGVGCRHLSGLREAPKYLQHFEIDEVRSVEHSKAECLPELCGRCRIANDLNGGRRVEDDH